MGVASLVLGIVCLVFALIPGLSLIGIIIGIIGIVLGALAKKNGQGGIATAGLVMSIIGTALVGVTYIACAACLAEAGFALDSLL